MVPLPELKSDQLTKYAPFALGGGSTHPVRICEEQNTEPESPLATRKVGIRGIARFVLVTGVTAGYPIHVLQDTKISYPRYCRMAVGHASDA